MKLFHTSRAWRLSVMAVLVLVLAAIVVVLTRGGGAQATVPTIARTATSAQSPAGVPSVTVGAPLAVRPVAAGFIGISTEYYGIDWYGGTDAAAPDPVFIQLLRNLAPRQRIVLRIGGDSADWLWLSTPGVKKGPALKVTINARTIAVLASIVKALNARVIIDLNLEAANLKLADNIARTITAAVGADHVDAYEIGNEPDLYDVLGWYTDAAGAPVLGRPKGYSIADYTTEFNQLGATLGTVPLAGPAVSRKWHGSLSSFIAQARNLKTVTVHQYASQSCGTHPGLASWPTIPKLLSVSQTLGIVTSLETELQEAHAAGKAIRVDELNSIACFGLQGVSNTYASALWALEASLQFARAGFDGLNFHTVPSAQYRLFVLTHHAGAWQGAVLPEYYGLLAFADAIPPGSQFLSTPDTGANPQIFAVETPGHQVHVIAVNTGAAGRLALHIPTAHGPALATYLRGPGLSATSGTTLAGQSFGARTTTGELTGTPAGTKITPVHGAYVVSLPAHSAAILSAHY